MIDQMLNWLRKYAAVLLLTVGLLLLYVFVRIGFWSVVGPILGVVVGSFVGVLGLVRNEFGNQDSVSNRNEPNPLDIRVPIILASIYVVSMIVLFRFSTYHRPLFFYVLFGGYTGIIGYQIARGERQGRIIPQILLLAFFTYWSSQFLFPAGMYGPDTHYRYIPAIETTLSTGYIPSTATIYMGHLGYVTEFTLVSGLSTQTAYFLLATLVLTGTIVLLASIYKILPAVSPQAALYAALIFSTSSWMIGRGMHPNKLNFFYPLILLLGISTIQVFRSGENLSSRTNPWVIIIVVVSPAIIFGHQFSAGAALVFLIVIGVYSVLSQTLLSNQYTYVPQGSVLFIVLAYLLAVLGNPIHQGPLLFRFSELVMSIIQSGSSAGPGRYSSLPLKVLFVSTAAQTLLFAISVLGAIFIFKKKRWEFDLVLFWLGSISVLLVVSILQNSSDTSPQRFYSLLTLFGFNVCAGVLLYHIKKQELQQTYISVDIHNSIVVIILIILSVASLASPIADTATSPVNEETPHFRQFETAQLNEGNEWAQQYISGEQNRIVPPDGTIQIRRVDQITGVANISQLNSGELYIYSNLAMRTGMVSDVGITLGGRSFVFVSPPAAPTDDRVYTNGQTWVHRH